MTFKIPQLTDHEMQELAKAWVRNEVFSDLHIFPHKKEYVLAIFPSMKEAMERSDVSREIIDNLGFVFAPLELRYRDKSIRIHEPGTLERVYPCFPACMFLHKNQREAVQKLITAERLFKKWAPRKQSSN